VILNNFFVVDTICRHLLNCYEKANPSAHSFKAKDSFLLNVLLCLYAGSFSKLKHVEADGSFEESFVC